MSLPIIDIRAAHGTDAAKQAVAAQVDRVCRQTGIFGITGHAISPSLMTQLHAAARAFFALPAADKQRHALDRVAASAYTDACPYGYSAMETENQSAFMGRRGPNDLVERLSAGPAILGDQALPLPCEQQAPGLRRAMEAYYRACKDTSAIVAELFAMAVGLPVDFFNARMADAHDAMRLNAYPGRHGQAHDLALASHTDATLFTLVSQDRDGLMIRKGAAWSLVEVPSPDVLIVNIGDLMMRWTNDEWVSTEHKVLLQDRPRLSVTYFKVVDQHTHIEVIPQFCETKPIKYEPTDFSRFITEKLNRLFQVS